MMHDGTESTFARPFGFAQGKLAGLSPHKLCLPINILANRTST
jgi:hypothetical protein